MARHVLSLGLFAALWGQLGGGACSARPPRALFAEALETTDEACRPTGCCLDLAHRRASRAYVGVEGTAAITTLYEEEADDDSVSLLQGSGLHNGGASLGLSPAVLSVAAPGRHSALEHEATGTRSRFRTRVAANDGLQANGSPREDPFQEHSGRQFVRRGPSPQAESAQVAIISLAICIGGMLSITGRGWGGGIAGLILLYFGVNSGFSLYMKFLLSDTEVSKDLQMQGLPAAFLVTAVQQVESFVLFALGMLVLWPTPWRWRPRPLTSWRDFATILAFSLAFAGNIGLNNFSISLLAVSLNLTIRSCLPLVTLGVQIMCGKLLWGSPTEVKSKEMALMVAGVLFAGFATLAKGEDPHGLSDSQAMFFGILACSCSLLAAAFNLVLAGVLGTQMRLSPLDISWYMSIPSAAFLVPPIFWLPHPAEWPDAGSLTDWQVLRRVLDLHPSTLATLLVSGGLAIGHNLLQYVLVQSLSATYTAFAGNVNKAVTITLSIILGVETLPGGIWSGVMLLSVTGNICSFTGYTALKMASMQSTSEDKETNSLPAKSAGEVSNAIIKSQQAGS